MKTRHFINHRSGTANRLTLMFSEWERTSPLMLHVSAEPGTGPEKFRVESEGSCSILCVEAETMVETPCVGRMPLIYSRY